jgi:hypothetical protein
MELSTVLQSLTSNVKRLTRRRSHGGSIHELYALATKSKRLQKYASPPVAPQLPDEARDNLRREYPRVRQLPFPYHTRMFGPVYAYAATKDGRAKCCTFDDLPVECYPVELLPFDPDAMGADEIAKLDRDVDIGGPTGKYPRPRETTIGEWFIHGPLFFNSLPE